MEYKLGQRVTLKADMGWGFGKIVECSDKTVGVRYDDGRLVRFEKERQELTEVKDNNIDNDCQKAPSLGKNNSFVPVSLDSEQKRRKPMIDSAYLKDAVTFFSRVSLKQLYSYKEFSDFTPPHYPGVYGWYFKCSFPGLPDDRTTIITNGKLLKEGWRLYYIGLGSSLYQRLIEKHFDGTASVSSLRLTLGSLLIRKLNLYLIQTPGNSYRFNDEKKLSEWICKNAKVAYFTCEACEQLEKLAIEKFHKELYLNTEHNFSKFEPLKDLRKNLKDISLHENNKPNKSGRNKCFKAYLKQAKGFRKRKK